MLFFSLSIVASLFAGVDQQAESWIIDSGDDWVQNIAESEGAKIADGSVSPERKIATVATKLHTTNKKRSGKFSSRKNSDSSQNAALVSEF